MVDCATAFLQSRVQEADELYRQLDRAATVRLIGTFSGLNIATCSEPFGKAKERADKKRFDHLPVRVNSKGPIVGLLDCRAPDQTPDTYVEDVMIPIGPGTLIAAEAPLIRFIESVDEKQECRLILDGTEINGIVTLSDLQKLPVRTTLFSLFIHLELLLTDYLKTQTSLPAYERVFEELPPGRKEKARVLWNKFRHEDMDQDPYWVLAFCDKRELLKKAPPPSLSCTKIERDLKRIERSLRDPIAHAHEYAATEKSALRICEAARLTQEWIGRLKPPAP